MPGPFTHLHPQLAALLLEEGWTGLTPIQEASFAPLAAGRHALLIAPTGHGKTEAAMLPILDRLLRERDALQQRMRPWPTGFKALYVTPLRALNRDLEGRLRSWCSRLGLQLGLRHGDTKPAERARQSRMPPDVLITTPETLQLLLYGDTLRKHLHTVRFTVVDEVHDLAQSERGAQLMVALERLEEAIAQPPALRDRPAAQRTCPTTPKANPGGQFLRIGLSATVAAPDTLGAWLTGGRPFDVVVSPGAKRIKLTVAQPVPGDEDVRLASDLSLTPEAVAQVRFVRHLVEAHRKVLVFQNTRDGAEVLASRSALLDGSGPLLLGLHHGSLSAAHRQGVEDDFKAGQLRGLIATSSLELGIDIGAIDHVVQVGSPRNVARLVQRLGRSGHHRDGVAAGTLVAAGPLDALECAAVARRAAAGELEPHAPRPEPLAVLANQVVALTNEYDGLHRDWAYEVIRRSGPFRDLAPEVFGMVWDALIEVGTTFADERQHRMARGGRARRHFLGHLSLIVDERSYRVLDEAAKRVVGSVDDSFVAAAMQPGSLLVMAGRSWRVLEVDPPHLLVRVAPVAELGPVPQWSGGQLPVSHALAQEVAHLRGLLAEEAGQARQAADPVRGGATLADYPLPAALRDQALAVVRAHLDAGLQVASDRLVTLEVGRSSTVVNVALGTRGNEALGRITQGLLAQRLGAPVGMESDAYQIHLTTPPTAAPLLADMWKGLDPDTLDLLLSMLLREAPQLRHQLVQVAKHFGALPDEVDPNATTRARIDRLRAVPALEEEALSRVIHDRLDLDAVAAFVRGLRAGMPVLVQAQGPLTHMGANMARLQVAPRNDGALLAAVRRRIEAQEALLACTNCGATSRALVRDIARRPHCRRCQSNQVACLRPWNEDQVALLRRRDALTPDEAAWRERARQNGALVAGFGDAAARALAARGVGPDTAARILQKSSDPESPTFWREVLQAELTFARTSAFWAR